MILPTSGGSGEELVRRTLESRGVELVALRETAEEEQDGGGKPCLATSLKNVSVRTVLS